MATFTRNLQAVAFGILPATQTKPVTDTCVLWVPGMGRKARKLSENSR